MSSLTNQGKVPPLASMERLLGKGKYFSNKILVTNGWGGCGKTCITSVLDTLVDTTPPQYSYEVEWVTHLVANNHISYVQGNELIKSITDLISYNLSLGRNLNTRLNDISSIFNSSKRIAYLKKALLGNESDDYRTEASQKTCHLVTHELFECRKILQTCFKDRLFFIEVVRDPFFMFAQAKYNLGLISDCKEKHFGFRYRDTLGHLIDDITPEVIRQDIDRATLDYLEARFNLYFQDLFSNLNSSSAIIIPFESFVIDPSSFLNRIETGLGHSFDAIKLKRVLRKERIPRSFHYQSRPRSIYRLVGWRDLRGVTAKNLSSQDERSVYAEYYKSIGVKSQQIDRLFMLSDHYRRWKSF